MTETSRHPTETVRTASPEMADPVAALTAMVGELAEQIDVLTGLVQGQDSEGSWMSQELSHLVRSSQR